MEWQLPDQKMARIRTRQHAPIKEDAFTLDEDLKDLGNGRFYWLKTFGCQANVRDGETMAGMLEMMGYQPTTLPEDADVIIMNTCAIRANAENKVFGEIGAFKHLKQAKPDLILAVCGCMMQVDANVDRIIAHYPFVDLVFGTHNLHRLPQLLYQAYFTKERTVEVYSEEGQVVEHLPVRRFGQGRAWVNIMYGCDKFCTYCIVPFTRGKERSRRMSDILEEVRQLKEQGYKEVTLLGQNVNAYGRDLDMKDGFASLLHEVALTGIDRVRFMTSHPWNFTMGMIDAMATHPNIMPFVHLPLQSGDDTILRRMGRRYTVDSYLETFDALKQRIPNVALSTDIIVGFPDETDEQFQKTLDLVDRCQFDNAYTFIFSPRSGTPAANMHDAIPMDVKRQRLAQLNQKVRMYAAMNNQAYQDRIVQVLVDGPSKKNPEIYSGYTESQKLVNFRRVKAQVNEIVAIRITEPKSWFLLGEEV